MYIYYSENVVTIRYEVVGPNGCGIVSPTESNIKVLTGAPSVASIATANKGYLFKGWYSDAACTDQVAVGTTLILQQPDDGWVPATYYAKFERGVADLTIKRENAEDGQVYVYQIQSKDDLSFVLNVTVVGNGSVTVHDLPIADYTITQMNDWSWRHKDAAQTVTVGADGKEVIFSDAVTNNQWLNGNSEREQNIRGQQG